jgi:molybdate transport system regulatory protein
MTGNPEVRVRAWLAWGSGLTVGKGRAALLEGVERFGSITRAAAHVGVTYRTAWKWVEEMNTSAPGPLVLAAAGGKGGGGAVLTPAGSAILAAYRLAVGRMNEAAGRVTEEVRGPPPPGTDPPART